MEQYKLLDGNRIKDVTTEGLFYLDAEDQLQYIDFAACYANFVRQMTEPDYWEHYKEINRLTNADWERHLQRLERWKEIGSKQPLTSPWADGQYIQFHTDPPIRFKFATVKEFQEAGGTILETRWKLMDLG
jgi:hypothetical protein